MAESFTLAQVSGNMGTRATYTAPNGDTTIITFSWRDRPYFTEVPSGGRGWALAGGTGNITVLKGEGKWYIYLAGTPETISRVPPPPADEPFERRSAYMRDTRQSIHGRNFLHSSDMFPISVDFAISPLLGEKLSAYIKTQAWGPYRNASNSTRVQKEEVHFHSPDFEPRSLTQVKRGVSEVAVSKNLPPGLGKSIASFLVPKTKKGGKRRGLRRTRKRATRRRNNKI